MRIAIDCRTILNPGFGENAGVGHYTYFLARNLLGLDQENEYVLFFDRQIGEEAVRTFVGNRPRTTVRFFPFHEYRQLMPFVYSHLLVTSAIARERCDVFHGPGGTLPASYAAPSVLTVHDLAIFEHPEWFPQSVLRRFSSTKLLLPRAIKIATRIIVPSETAAHDLRGLFRASETKVRVIPHGVTSHEKVFGRDPETDGELPDASDVRARHHLGGRYFFFVGTIEPRKNLAALVRAFRSLVEETAFRDVTLAIAGARGWKYDEVFREIDATNRAAHREVARYLGYVSAKDKFALMKHATAFVFPSRAEGFGLPVLEAMSMGTPVVTSNASSLPEVVGDAALLVSPEDEDALARALKAILTDEALRSRLGAAGKARAAEFSWIKTAEQTLEVYREAVSG